MLSAGPPRNATHWRISLDNLKDYVVSFDNVLDEEFCTKLINQFDTASNSPHFRQSKHSWDLDYRSFKELNISKDESFAWAHSHFYDVTQSLVDDYKKICRTMFFPEKFGFEDARMKKYENDGFDQFGWHVDVGDYPSARRYLVVFYYLNDVEEGGETVFHFGSSKYAIIKPKRGRIVMFPPMWMFPHIGTKPISSTKYIVSTYLHYL